MTIGIKFSSSVLIPPDNVGEFNQSGFNTLEPFLNLSSECRPPHHSGSSRKRRQPPSARPATPQFGCTKSREKQTERGKNVFQRRWESTRKPRRSGKPACSRRLGRVAFGVRQLSLATREKRKDAVR